MKEQYELLLSGFHDVSVNDYIVGIDPGYASMGVAVTQIVKRGRVNVIETIGFTNRVGDPIDRVKFMWAGLEVFMSSYEERIPRAHYVLEGLDYFGAKTKGSDMANIGFAVGYLAAAINRLNPLSIYVLQPRYIRRVFTGDASAAKERTRAVAKTMYPSLKEGILLPDFQKK